MKADSISRIISYEQESRSIQHSKTTGNTYDLALRIIKSRHLTYQQKLRALAKVAEDSIPYPSVKPETIKLMDEGIIHDLDEGHAPYRPRYIVPDYSVVLRNGSKFFEIDPPENMYEAIGALMSTYVNTPSITSYPVYLGDIDELLMPFADTVTDAELTNLLRMFWGFIDKAFPDAFVHANLSPQDNVVSRKILDIDKSLSQVVPNLSLKYDPHTTPNELALKAVMNALEMSKPYLVNHPLVMKDWPKGYGVASCYNILPLGGGSFTLIRINLLKLARKYGGDLDQILNEGLPVVVEAAADLVEARASFIIEESGFFETSFLAREGLIHQNNFTAMLGVYAMAEAMEYMAKVNRIEGEYGSSEVLNEYAVTILDRIYREVEKRRIKYLEGSGGKMTLHSQAGISSDKETPGIRVKYGSEPHYYDYIELLARMHRYIKSGTSEIFVFNQLSKHNAEAVLDIVNGAFESGMKFFSITSTFSKFIRVTGYLIKREDLEKFKANEVARHDTAYLGSEAVINQGVFRRRPIMP